MTVGAGPGQGGRLGPLGSPAVKAAAATEPPTVIERRRTPLGELVLRRQGEHYEIIANGTFLMDTRGGESERLLARAPLDRGHGPARVLIGGLGVGFTLAAAIAHPRVQAVDVVECEPAVLGWHRDPLAPLAPFSGGAVTDPRVRLINADLVGWLRDTATEVYDVACVDIDNGPDWTVIDANAALYDDAGLALLRARLRPGGVLAVWSAHEAPRFERRLRAGFTQVEALRVPVRRGAPDVIYVAAKPVESVQPR